MAIEFKDELYFLALWHFELPAHTGNFMGAIWRDPEPANRWQFRYRFRYYKDDKLDTTSKDERNWYEGEVKDRTEEQVLAEFGMVIEAISILAGSPADRIDLRCYGKEALKKFLAAKPHWLHYQLDLPGAGHG